MNPARPHPEDDHDPVPPAQLAPVHRIHRSAGPPPGDGRGRAAHPSNSAFVPEPAASPARSRPTLRLVVTDGALAQAVGA